MLRLMNSLQTHDYIQGYEAGLAALRERPNDRELQHQVVLALARAGALDFAIEEYDRYGLGAVRDHEDIMALNARLSKDLYLRHTGKVALQYAREAARKYEAAFHNTLGYYSGINSATMAVMADLSPQLVGARIEAIEALLPVSKDVTPEDHYFTEATRAECFLLKGEKTKAIAALHSAISFDPLNYAAHASTLKQFRMICTKRGEEMGWLSDFTPPRPIHFAGHIRLNRTPAEQEALKITVADALQQQDVGFGYGALAAGGDILMAEALLEQGAELHVVLPCKTDLFVAESVKPFGENWIERFEACLAQATSVRHMAQSVEWPNEYLNRLAGLSAMGHAVLQGEWLSVLPAQMLILKDGNTNSYTATHAQDWQRGGHDQFRISSHAYHAMSASVETGQPKLNCVLKTSIDQTLQHFECVIEAVKAALELRASTPSAKVALHMTLEGVDAEEMLDPMLENGAPQTCLASEAFASVLAAICREDYDIIYAGRVGQVAAQPIRCFAIQTRANLLNAIP